VFDVRRETAGLLERIHQDVAQGGALIDASDKNGPTALHGRRGANRMEILLVEIDVGCGIYSAPAALGARATS
jgi:hypothetical protein